MEMAALVVPEGRPIRVHNDGTSQVNVKVLDGGLGRSAALLPGEIWSVLDADGALAGFELRLLVCSAENEMDTAGWCAALIRVEKCDATTQYGEDTLRHNITLFRCLLVVYEGKAVFFHHTTTKTVHIPTVSLRLHMALVGGFPHHGHRLVHLSLLFGR